MELAVLFSSKGSGSPFVHINSPSLSTLQLIQQTAAISSLSRCFHSSTTLYGPLFPAWLSSLSMSYTRSSLEMPTNLH